LQKELIGYADEISVPRGATIAFKVSTDAPHYDGAIVRLIHGDANGPGFKEEVIQAEKRHNGRKQLAHSGSYGIVADHPALSPTGSFTIQMWIYATTPRNGVVQGLLSKWSKDGGYALAIGETGDIRLREIRHFRVHGQGPTQRNAHRASAFANTRLVQMIPNFAADKVRVAGQRVERERNAEVLEDLKRTVGAAQNDAFESAAVQG